MHGRAPRPGQRPRGTSRAVASMVAARGRMAWRARSEHRPSRHGDGTDPSRDGTWRSTPSSCCTS